MKRRFGIFVAAAALAWTAPAAAQDAKGFGDKGQLILTADRLFPLFSFTSVSTTETQAGVTTTETTKGSSFVLLVGAEPQVSSIHTVPRVAVDYTVIKSLTVGGSVIVAFGLGGSTSTEQSPAPAGGQQTTSRDAPSTTILGIGPRVGYILPVGDVLAIWPRGGFSFYSVRTKSTRTNNGTDTTTTDGDTFLSLDIDPQLAIVPIPHFFFHVGPLLNIPLTGSRKHEVAAGGRTDTTSIDLSVWHFGISTGLGGWFDL